MIAVLILAWGSTFAAVKIGLRHSPPVLFGGIRSVVGGLVVMAIAVRLGRAARVREQARWYLLLTLLNVIGMFGLQVLAIEKLPSGLAAVLIYLQPVLTGVLAGPLLGERVGRTALLGLLVGFAGIAAVGVGALDGHVSLVGVGYALGTALAWSLGTITVKRAPVDLWWAVALPFTVGGVVLCLLSAAFESGSISWTPSFVVALAYSTFVGTSLSWGLWFALVAAGEATRAAAVIFFVPLVSLVIGVVALHETLHASLVVGAALVVLGVWLVNRRTPQSAPPEQPPAPHSADGC
jgi:drug/metabolite transporter (DMT)-like permease